jgi:tripartite-type tricarboxylate transporter receptor subunit TctC
MKRRHALLLLALAAALPAAHSQIEKWPAKSVRVISPVAPGSSTDIVARMLAQRLSEEFGQQFIVDNRAGAGGTIGAAIVAHAIPNGYTIAVASGSYAATATLQKLTYDPIKDIAPIALITDGPMILAAHPSVKATNLTELIELARAKPDALLFGSTGVGTMAHFAIALLQQETKTNFKHVPYKGAGPTIIALRGGEIQLAFVTAPTAIPYIKKDELRGIAVTSEQRSLAMPDLPAISELVPGYSANVWTGMWAPAGTPKEVIWQLNQAIGRFLKQPDVQKQLHADAREPTYSTPEEFARIIARDIAKWSKLVKAGNIKLND